MLNAEVIASQMSGWAGRFVELRIEDEAGHDPSPPPKLIMLEGVELIGDGDSLKLLFDKGRFFAVPLLQADPPLLEGKTLVSRHAAAQLTYRVSLI